MRESNRGARAARFLVQIFLRSLPNDDVKFSYLMTTTTVNNSKSFVCLCMKTIRVKQAKLQLADFVQRHRHGTITKHLIKRKGII